MLFDNLQVNYTAGNIVEENHYYSYGLRIAAISSKKLGNTKEGKLRNFYLYNEKELPDEDADLGWYDYGFRNYDPQIGRFSQLDPLTFEYPFYTPYQFAGCDPITNVDVDGLEPAGSVIGTLAQPGRMQGIVVTAVRHGGHTLATANTLLMAGKVALRCIKFATESTCIGCAQRNAALNGLRCKYPPKSYS